VDALPIQVALALLATAVPALGFELAVGLLRRAWAK